MSNCICVVCKLEGFVHIFKVAVLEIELDHRAEWSFYTCHKTVSSVDILACSYYNVFSRTHESVFSGGLSHQRKRRSRAFRGTTKFFCRDVKIRSNLAVPCSASLYPTEWSTSHSNWPRRTGIVLWRSSFRVLPGSSRAGRGYCPMDPQWTYLPKFEPFTWSTMRHGWTQTCRSGTWLCWSWATTNDTWTGPSSCASGKHSTDTWSNTSPTWGSESAGRTPINTSRPSRCSLPPKTCHDGLLDPPFLSNPPWKHLRFQYASPSADTSMICSLFLHCRWAGQGGRGELWVGSCHVFWVDMYFSIVKQLVIKAVSEVFVFFVIQLKLKKKKLNWEPLKMVTRWSE